MDKKTLEASITEWERKRIAQYPGGVNSNYCPLCDLYGNDGCLGCPIYDAGFEGCKDTPWFMTRIKLSNWGLEPNNPTFYQEWKDAAQAEIDFLKSLLTKA